ncbi:hypothetical protein [Streptomyces sp. NPDC050534]|uniref:hypothetical protein n=1 Tax=Streptomyces sp. NPDC050534 TaxID=3365625 RepID=UPI0037A9C123
MSGSFDVAQALSGGVSDRDRAWTFIRDFAAAWGEPLVEHAGSLTAELARAEATLGCSLPAALLDVYALVGSRPDLVANQDPLLPPHEMFVDLLATPQEGPLVIVLRALRADQYLALDLALMPKRVDGTRAKLKRLVSLGFLDETEPDCSGSPALMPGSARRPAILIQTNGRTVEDSLLPLGSRVGVRNEGCAGRCGFR